MWASFGYKCFILLCLFMVKRITHWVWVLLQAWGHTVIIKHLLQILWNTLIHGYQFSWIKEETQELGFLNSWCFRFSVYTSTEISFSLRTKYHVWPTHKNHENLYLTNNSTFTVLYKCAHILNGLHIFNERMSLADSWGVQGFILVVYWCLGSSICYLHRRTFEISCTYKRKSRTFNCIHWHFVRTFGFPWVGPWL